MTAKGCPSTKGFGLVVLWGLAIGGPRDGVAQSSPEAEAEVTAVVEAFLEAAGRRGYAMALMAFLLIAAMSFVASGFGSPAEAADA